MDELWNTLAIRLSEKIDDLVTARLRSFMDRYCRSEIRVCFSEAEAAKQLGISRDTLASWRKNKLISYVRYPQAQKDALSDMYSYDLVDLMNFRERFKIHAAGNNVFEMKKEISLLGPEVRKAA